MTQEPVKTHRATVITLVSATRARASHLDTVHASVLAKCDRRPPLFFGHADRPTTRCLVHAACEPGGCATFFQLVALTRRALHAGWRRVVAEAIDGRIFQSRNCRPTSKYSSASIAHKKAWGRRSISTRVSTTRATTSWSAAFHWFIAEPLRVAVRALQEPVSAHNGAENTRGRSSDSLRLALWEERSKDGPRADTGL